MDIKTEEILRKDSLAETERMFGGKHWSEFNGAENMVALFNCITDNEIKAKHLEEIGDTYHSMSWDYFKNLITSKGFVNGYTYDFAYNGFDESHQEEAVIYYHPSKGLVIWATSFNGKQSVNGGSLYGEIKANTKDDEMTIWCKLSTGGCIDKENLIFETSHDVREGLFSKLSALEEAGTFLNKWTNRNRFLWFVDYVEDDVPGYDYKKITKEKIIKCTKGLQDIICG